MALVGLGCGEATIDERVTIPRGVYGQALAESDGEHEHALVVTDFDVVGLDGTVHGSAWTGGQLSFYEVALEPGTYRICPAWGVCGPFFEIDDVAPLVRCDLWVDDSAENQWECVEVGAR